MFLPIECPRTSPYSTSTLSNDYLTSRVHSALAPRVLFQCRIWLVRILELMLWSLVKHLSPRQLIIIDSKELSVNYQSERWSLC